MRLVEKPPNAHSSQKPLSIDTATTFFGIIHFLNRDKRLGLIFSCNPKLNLFYKRDEKGTLLVILPDTITLSIELLGTGYGHKLWVVNLVTGALSFKQD